MSKDNEEKKKTLKISEETKQLITNLIITTVSTAALIISIATGMKGRDRS